MRCAYWFTSAPSCFARAYSLLRLDEPEADLDGVELVPRRCGGRGSPRRPASESKRHLPPSSTIGNRQRPLLGPDGPGWRRFGSCGSTDDLGLLARQGGEGGRLVPVLTGSSVTTRSTPSGPRICLQRRDVEALGGEDRGPRPPPRACRMSVCSVAAAAGADRAARLSAPARRPATQGREARGATEHPSSRSGLIALTSAVRRRRRHQPPPRDPMLEAPRELLARALLPL